MAAETRTAILTRDSATAEAVKAVVEGEALTASGVYRDLVTLMTSLEHEAVPVVVVDAGGDPMSMLDALEPVVNRYAHSRFVVLADDPSSDMVMRAMQIGVRHVQAKNGVSRELPSVLQRLARGTGLQATALGSMYTILSAGGGCGSTTLAVNLAHELQLAGPEVLLVDLDYAYGTVAAYLGLRSHYSVADVFRQTGTIDSHLVRTTAVKAGEKLYALLSPASIYLGGVEPIPAGVLEQIIPAFKQGFVHTVVDAPRVSMNVAEGLVRASETVFVVLQASVKDVRHARTIMTELARRGAPADRFQPILNRYHKRRQMVSVAEVQKALGEDYPLECLSNDYKSVIQSLNYGQPLAEAAPRSRLRRELTKLAAHTAGLTNGRLRS